MCLFPCILNLNLEMLQLFLYVSVHVPPSNQLPKLLDFFPMNISPDFTLKPFPLSLLQFSSASLLAQHRPSTFLSNASVMYFTDLFIRGKIYVLFTVIYPSTVFRI